MIGCEDQDPVLPDSGGAVDAVETSNEDQDLPELSIADSAGETGDGWTDAPVDAGKDDTDITVDAPETRRLGPHACLLDPECANVMVTAHRGYHIDIPENSLAGLRIAAELGADFVEVDVRHTSDEVLVLMHDGTVDRTTNGTGNVDELTWEDISALQLIIGNPEITDSMMVPLFSDALALAEELGVMLYVDQKTHRYDLVLEVIQDGDYYDVALIRDDWGTIQQMAPLDSELLVMPSVEDDEMLDLARAELPNLLIVELGQVTAHPAFCEYAHGLGIKVQQDVMALGDAPALVVNDYTGWKSYVEAGVDLLQTDLPHILIPLVHEYEQTGAFPDHGQGSD